MNELSLKVNGQSFTGWKKVQVQKSIEQIAGTFSIVSADAFPDHPSNWGIKMGDSCVIEIDNNVILTGYIDDINIDYSKSGGVVEHELKITGRDVTADLVDCSYAGQVGQFTDQSIETLISALCFPFSINVKVDTTAIISASEIKDSFVPDQGETVFELITKLTKLRGILPVSYGDGKLTLTGAGSDGANDTIELGVNVISGALLQSNKDRFSNYWVKGQANDGSNLQLNDFTEPGGQEIDNVIQRYRPLVILSEDEVDINLATVRAQWEAKRRAAKSRQLIYKVANWVQTNGDPWAINTLVHVKDSFLNVNTTKLIVGVSFSQDRQNGSTTTLQLADKEAYQLSSNVTKIKTNFDPPISQGNNEIFFIRPFPRAILLP